MVHVANPPSPGSLTPAGICLRGRVKGVLALVTYLQAVLGQSSAWSSRGQSRDAPRRSELLQAPHLPSLVLPVHGRGPDQRHADGRPSSIRMSLRHTPTLLFLTCQPRLSQLAAPSPIPIVTLSLTLPPSLSSKRPVPAKPEKDAADVSRSSAPNSCSAHGRVGAVCHYPGAKHVHTYEHVRV